jgi:tRNA (adenine22-N1)-methyltransferase
MESIRLSPRLEALAGLVPQGCRLADVGTDHGFLPIRLLLDGVIKSAVASDLRPGPLSAARKNAAAAGTENIRFCLCDGLEGISPEETDTVVIAGMGGETIAVILEKAPWVCRGKTLILQPMTRQEVLRKALERMGLRIERERLVQDSGRIYSILLARAGEPERCTEAEYFTGRYALISREALFGEYLTQWENKLDRALAGLSAAEDQRHLARREQLVLIRGQLKQMRDDYGNGI